MTEFEKLKKQLKYNAHDEEIFEQIISNHTKCEEYNQILAKDLDKRVEKLPQIINIKEDSYVLPPFRCDFGFNVSIGKNSFINMDSIILDSAPVTIGDNVFIGPNLRIYTPIHPLDSKTRNTGLEWAKPVVIEDDVWIGGSVVIMPGVTIKKGSVIGAGSVVTKDVEPDTLNFGNPALKKRDIIQ